MPISDLSGNSSITRRITASDVKNPIELGTMNAMNSGKWCDKYAGAEALLQGDSLGGDNTAW
jgi:hypothetical protein